MEAVMNISVKKILLSLFFILISITCLHSRAFSEDILVVDFGASKGLWTRTDAAIWTQIHGLNPEDIATGDIDGNGTYDLIVDFGATYGLWAYMNNAIWVQLHGLNPEQIVMGDIDASGKDDLIIDFGANVGLWAFKNNSSWVQLHSLSPEQIVTGNIDGNGYADIIVDFGATYGLWTLMNYQTWTQLHGLSSEDMVIGDIDGSGTGDVIIDFGVTYGIWAYMNNATWVQLHSLSPEQIVTGSIDATVNDDLIIDFGATYGLWALLNNATWVQIHGLSPEDIVTGNIDAYEKYDDIIIDFGATYGIWASMNNASWVQLHNVSPEGLSIAATMPGSIIRASVDSAGLEGNDFSSHPSINGNSRYVAFQSTATNLVAGDTNGVSDVFIRDNLTGATTRASVDNAGLQGNNNSYVRSFNNDGRYVAFDSLASNLVAGDTNGVYDVFLHFTPTNQTFRVSVDSAGQEGNNNSHLASINGSGRYVAFTSAATNLVAGDTNGVSDVFLHDILSRVTTRVSVNSAGLQGNGNSTFPSISNDGRYVAFQSTATNLVAGDTNGAFDIFVHDTLTGATTRASVDSAGLQGNGFSNLPSISDDGRYVAFESTATNLVAGDTNGMSDIFVHDTVTGTTTRVSVGYGGLEGSNHSTYASISGNGRYVAFESISNNLVPLDTFGYKDVFVHDRQTSTTTRVSVRSSGLQGNNISYDASISNDGRYVAFQSAATNLVVGDTNSKRDIFVVPNQ